MVTSCNPFKTYWNQKFYSQIHNETVFINCIGLGVTGDHRIVKISLRKNQSTKQNNKEYFLNSFSYVFYKFQNDSLYIYTEEKFEPPENDIFKTPIIFKIIDIKDFNQSNYKKCGLHRISPYPDSK